MAKLTSKARNALPDSAFALPGRRYPIHDKAHQDNALSRVSQNGTPAEKKAVRAKVAARRGSSGSKSGGKTTAKSGSRSSSPRKK